VIGQTAEHRSFDARVCDEVVGELGEHSGLCWETAVDGKLVDAD
jgi:hypothetical protein